VTPRRALAQSGTLVLRSCAQTPLRAVAVAVAVCALTVSSTPASAQRLVLAANADAASGLEGGTYLRGTGIRRARTTLRLGLDGSVDESPENAIAAALLVELEPHAALGAEVRVVRALFTNLSVEAGGIAYLAPQTLLGATAGFTYRVPLRANLWLTIGPSINGYFLGSDLPAGTVLWQALVRGGLRVRF